MRKEPFRPLVVVEEVRAKLRRAAEHEGQMGRLWRCVRRLARERPGENPWFVPFVAVMESDKVLLEHARTAVRAYLDKAQDQGSSHYLFNIWCFAFPHCRWAIWFDLLRRAGAYEPDEAAREAARFLLIQHRDHYAGLLVKPYPECVDNQAAALCLSSLVVGALFADEPGGRNLARLLREEATERLEAMIGGMPRSGYSGEGSTYQSLIVAFALPFLTELLERIRGADLFDKPLKPNGTSPHDILRATARLWMPGGLLLPWDDYGYQFGVQAPIAYLARRTGDPQYLAMLEHVANWARLNGVSVGWGHDEPVWTLIYWPETARPPAPVWQGWTERELGGVLVNPDGSRYLMQMWDHTDSLCGRMHVNPNSLILEVNGVPLCADGTPANGGPEPLRYPDAVVGRHYGPGWTQELNLSKGCGGSHGCILVDRWEGLRPARGYEPSRAVETEGSADTVTGDVSGLYRSAIADARCVRRRSRLVENSYWLVEDLVQFEREHEFTCRWWFRPDVRVAEDGADLMTTEGVGLQLRSLLAPARAEVTRIEGFPLAPDGCSDRVDFYQRGRTIRWLWLLWPVTRRRQAAVYADGWQAMPVTRDTDVNRLDFARSIHSVQPGSLPWLQADVPVARTWAFRRVIAPPPDVNAWLRLPRGLHSGAFLWVDGQPVTLPEPAEHRDLLASFVPLPRRVRSGETVEIRLSLCFHVGHPQEKEGRCHPDTPLSLWLEEATCSMLQSASCAQGMLTFKTTDGAVRRVAHAMMAEEAGYS